MPLPTAPFTVDEANALVPRLRPLLAQLREAFHEFSFARDQWQDAASAGDEPEAELWLETMEERAALVEKLLADVRALGCEVKDPTLGLVDWPARRKDGSIVLLCYRDDEDAVRFWHPIETGFAGRRPVAEL